jgi:hypothetical protein
MYFPIFVSKFGSAGREKEVGMLHTFSHEAGYIVTESKWRGLLWYGINPAAPSHCPGTTIRP